MNNASENREVIPPPRVVAAMRRVLNYLWWDEQADYLSLPRHERAGHIFVSLKLFHEWLMGRLIRDNEAASAAGELLIQGGTADERR